MPLTLRLPLSPKSKLTVHLGGIDTTNLEMFANIRKFTILAFRARA
jgi:hypothetical protein